MPGRIEVRAANIKGNGFAMREEGEREHILGCDFAPWEECAEHEHVVVNTKF